MRSLQGRLTLSLALALLLVFLLLLVSVNLAMQRMIEGEVASRLEHDGEAILALLEHTSDGSLHLDSDRLPAIYNRSFSGHYFEIRSAQQTLRSRSLWDEELPQLPEGVRSSVNGPLDQQLLVYTATPQVGSQQLRLCLAEDIGEQQLARRHFARTMFVFLLGALVLLLLVQRWVIRRAVRPLASLGEQFAALERGETALLDGRRMPSEVLPLIGEVNRLLEVLRQRLERSRNAVGNLAHSLKTPLTLLSQSCDRREPVDAEALRQPVLEIRQRIERELSRARLAGRSIGGYWPEPEKDLRDLADMLEKIHRGIVIAIAMPSAMRLAADREDMLELFGNLLENGCKWADGEVRCSFRREGAVICVQIEDDGPGMAEEQLAEVMQRGVRADESRPGHGLGLSIVREIVEAYQGEMQLGRSPQLGGLRVQLRLPQVSFSSPSNSSAST